MILLQDMQDILVSWCDIDGNSAEWTNASMVMYKLDEL